LLRYLRAAPTADKSSGNGTSPITMPRSYLDVITGRDSRQSKEKEVVRG
jgi:hypothetical protein